MIKHVVRIFIIISFIFVLNSFASETKFTQKFNAKEGFTLQLPDQWVRIPGNVLEEQSTKLQKVAPDTEKLQYDYGFQLSGDRPWLTRPYILICLNNTGRIPEGKMKRINNKKTGSKPIDEKISGIPNTEVGEVLYNSDAHTLWMTFLADAEKVKGLIATKLTQKGCIQIVCYADVQDFDEYRNFFESIVKNIYLSEELEYKSRITDSIPIISLIDFDKLLSHVFTSALLIVAIWLLLSRIKKKS